jgi:hypothetical protein
MTYLSLTMEFDYIDKKISNQSGVHSRNRRKYFQPEILPGPGPQPSHTSDMTDQQIFDALKIHPTDVRRAIMKILLSREAEPFTIDEIYQEQTRKKFSFTKTSVANTLRLLRVRGFLVPAGEKKYTQRGRPVSLFQIAAGYAAKT